jgi:hypothetical protein
MDPMSITRRKHEYDLPTAVTFLIAGFGLGSMLTLLFASRFEQALQAHPESSPAVPLRRSALNQPAL